MEQMRLMAQLIHKLSQRDSAAIFNQPVKASEYPDYHEIVKTPMDLGTIQDKIARGEYASLKACAEDVRTVWTNAYLYNPPESVVAQGARSLSKVFEGLYNKINPSDFNYAREPNTDERHKFSRDIYRVEDSYLQKAVELLEQRCPDAVLRDNSEGHFVVRVDALPPPVFWEVELYLRGKLCNQPDRTKKKIPTTFRSSPELMERPRGRKRSLDAGNDHQSGPRSVSETCGMEITATRKSEGRFAPTESAGTNRTHDVGSDHGTDSSEVKRADPIVGNESLLLATGQSAEPEVGDGHLEGTVVGYESPNGAVADCFPLELPDTGDWAQRSLGTTFQGEGAYEHLHLLGDDV